MTGCIVTKLVLRDTNIVGNWLSGASGVQEVDQEIYESGPFLAEWGTGKPVLNMVFGELPF
jgi:hypothetical protein